jgi:hypothetical protein
MLPVDGAELFSPPWLLSCEPKRLPEGAGATEVLPPNRGFICVEVVEGCSMVDGGRRRG